jgi:hypothetical protein
LAFALAFTPAPAPGPSLGLGLAFALASALALAFCPAPGSTSSLEPLKNSSTVPYSKRNNSVYLFSINSLSDQPKELTPSVLKKLAFDVNRLLQQEL